MGNKERNFYQYFVIETIIWWEERQYDSLRQGELRRSLRRLISSRGSLNLAAFEFYGLSREPIRIRRVVNLRSGLHRPLFLPPLSVSERSSNIKKETDE